MWKGRVVRILSWNEGKVYGGYVPVLILLLYVLLSVLTLSLGVKFIDKIKRHGVVLVDESKVGLQSLQTLSSILSLDLDITEVKLGVVVVDDPRVEVLLWPTIAGEISHTIFTLLSLKNVVVRFIGGYAQDDAILVLLLSMLLSTLIISLGIEFKDEIKRLGVASIDD